MHYNIEKSDDFFLNNRSLTCSQNLSPAKQTDHNLYTFGVPNCSEIAKQRAQNQKDSCRMRKNIAVVNSSPSLPPNTHQALLALLFHANIVFVSTGKLPWLKLSKQKVALCPLGNSFISCASQKRRILQPCSFAGEQLCTFFPATPSSPHPSESKQRYLCFTDMLKGTGSDNKRKLPASKVEA